MVDFFHKSEYAWDDILYLINDGVEESIKLDFKSAGSLEKTDPKKREIGKDVSAFANSAGGLIIYGITEKDHKAAGLSFIDGTIYTKEWLEHVISEKVSPRIDDLKIFPLRKDGDVRRSVYIVQIPQSKRVHMNADKKYYRRYNFESVAMEEYEVRNLYLRASIVELDITEIDIRTRERVRQGGKLQKCEITLRFAVLNNSDGVSHHYKMEISLPKNYLNNLDKTYLMDLKKNYVNEENGYVKYSVSNRSPIFQGEKDYMFSLAIPINRSDRNLLDQPIFVRLYYTTGKKEKNILLKDTYEKLPW